MGQSYLSQPRERHGKAVERSLTHSLTLGIGLCNLPGKMFSISSYTTSCGTVAYTQHNTTWRVRDTLPSVYARFYNEQAELAPAQSTFAYVLLLLLSHSLLVLPSARFCVLLCSAPSLMIF